MGDEMKIKLNDIIIGDRYRKEFVNIDSLAESIRLNGLIHPITIDENNLLIAGERRYKACQMLKLEEVEVNYRKDLTEVQKKEIEIEENLRREQFTWPEEVTAKAQLHKLKQSIYGAAISGHVTEGTWKLQDTADALGESKSGVSQDIALARGLKAFPELLKEKSKSIAFKKMKEKQEKLLQEELNKRMKDRGIVSHPNVIHGNCIEEMMKMEANSIDLILTDPPYGIDIGDAQTFGRTSPQKTYEDSDHATFDLLDKAIKEMYRVLKTDRHMYMFFAIDKYESLITLLRKHGFEVHHIPLIWEKGSGSYPSQSTTFVHSYEPFLHISKGKRKLNGTPRDLFPIKRVPSNKKIHPSEKPTELLRDLIGFSTLPGEIVLDCFGGSGSTAVAARECNRKSVVIERDLAFYEGICKRLEGNDTEEA